MQTAFVRGAQDRDSVARIEMGLAMKCANSICALDKDGEVWASQMIS